MAMSTATTLVQMKLIGDRAMRSSKPASQMRKSKKASCQANKLAISTGRMHWATKGLTMSEDETLVIEVADDGPGVSSADVERIFRPFVTTKPNGSGIGLSLARQIAHAHGGALTLERTPATVFRLSLP
ncbi:ATP-binding protein [Brevundimonas sp. RM1]